MLTIDLSTAEADAQRVREKLNQYNFQIVPPDRHETLYLIAREDGELAGGLIADTAWEWLHVDLFWVEQARRSQGLGSRLLAQAEEIAAQRGCKHACLETHDFQSLGFYQKRGYGVFGQLDDFPPGHTKYFLSKRL
jgi:GNAT superfamily N-acetyltransferase